MALTRTKLADIAYVASSAGSLYANPASTKSLIAGLTLFNGNATAELVKIYVVPDSSGSAGTAGAGNQVAEITLQTKETYFFGFEFPMLLTDTNDTIQASTTTASKVTAIVHGDTIT